MKIAPNVRVTPALRGLVVATVVASVLAGIGVSRANETAQHGTSHQVATPISPAGAASNRGVTVTVPGSARTVSAIDPTKFGTQVSTKNAQAAIAAQAAAAAVLTPADYQRAEQAFAQMMAQAPVGLPAQDAIGTNSATTATVQLAATHKVTVTIYRWELEAVAWYYIVMGGTVAAVGAFVDFTGVGIPVGAVLNAIGIGTGVTGSFILWYADTYFGDHRTYTITW